MKNPFKNFFKGAEQDVAQVPVKQQDPLISQYYSNKETEKLHDTYTREFSELTTENLRFYFLAARKGINFFKAFLFEEIKRRDLRIGGICETRKLSVLSNEWDIEGTNQELVNFIKDNFNRINIYQTMSDVVEAQLQGMSVFQLFYKMIGNKMYLDNVTLVPNYLVYSKGQVKFIDFDKINIFSLRSEASSETPNLPLIELDPNYMFEVYSFDGNEENGLLNGLIDSIIFGFFFKSYGIKDYAIFMERWASPGVVGEYDPLMSKTDRDQLWLAVQNYGNVYKAVIPNTAKLNTFSDIYKASSGILYENYIKYWDDSISIRVKGEALTTNTGPDGSYAKAKVGENISEDKKYSDKILIKAAFNGLIKKIIDINFANVKDYPKFEFKEGEDLDYETKKAAVMQTLHNAGFDVDEEQASEIFDLVLTRSAMPPSLPFSQKFAEKKEIDAMLDDIWKKAKES